MRSRTKSTASGPGEALHLCQLRVSACQASGCGNSLRLFASGWGRWLKDGSCELNAPDRAALIELALFPDEGGRVTAEDPNVNVGWLLADNGSDEAGDAAEFDLDAVVGDLVAEAANDERIFA